MDTDRLPLGRHVDYPRHYDATLLFPIPRAQGRASLGLAEGAPLRGVLPPYSSAR